MTLDDFVTTYTGQAVSYDGVQADFGQCLQLVCLYWQQVYGYNCPDMAGAVDLWTNADVLANFDQIPVGQEQSGDVAVWGASSLINSPEYGHTAIVITPNGSTGFTSFDSNWGGVTASNGYPAAHQVQHDMTDVLGFLRKGEGMNPTPAQAGATYAAFATESDGITPGDISQTDLNTAIQTPWAEWIPNFYAGVQTLRNDIQLLTQERDQTLYPFVNAVCDALGLPDQADTAAVVTAIKALQNGTILAPGNYVVK